MDKSFKLHPKKIDNQHKRFLSIVNRMHDELLDGKSTSSVNRGMLLSLYDYANFYYRLEEQMMKSSKYPDIEDHQKHHQYFIDIIQNNLDQGFTSRDLLNPTVMVEMLTSLKKHLLKDDMKFICHLRKNPNSK